MDLEIGFFKAPIYVSKIFSKYPKVHISSDKLNKISSHCLLIPMQRHPLAEKTKDLNNKPVYPTNQPTTASDITHHNIINVAAKASKASLAFKKPMLIYFPFRKKNKERPSSTKVNDLSLNVSSASRVSITR